MEIGKIYILKGSYRPGSNVYRLMRFDKFSWTLHFWYKNKFGEGETTRDYYRYKDDFILAPRALQVLYGR